MFIADFLFVKQVLKIGYLLMFMLMKDKLLTFHLTFSRFLTLNYERRLKRGSRTNKNELVKTKK